MEIAVDIEKYLCVICQEILTDPVTLPCFHTCCLFCLERTLDCNKYQCFLCRKFIGSWYRLAKKSNRLINEDLSLIIAKNLPYLTQQNLKREITGVQLLRTSRPGEIKAEFDSFLQKIEGEKLAQQEKENKLSEEFIAQLEEEERNLKLKQEELLKSDEVIARELASEMDPDQCSVNEKMLNQLSSDEELAKKLASEEELLISVNPVTPKRCKSSKESPSTKKLKFVKSSWSSKSKITSPKMVKNKFSSSIKFGPMDKFVDLLTKRR